MKTIHKFRLNSDKRPNVLTLKQGYRVVRSEYVVADKAVYLWVEQPLSVEVPSVRRTFQVAYSGDALPASFEYVDTALDPFGPEAYHVYEVREESFTLSPVSKLQSDAFAAGGAHHQGVA